MKKRDFEIAKEYYSRFIKKDKPELVLLTGSRVFGMDGTDFDLCIIADIDRKYLVEYSDFVAVKKYPAVFKGCEFEVQKVTWNYIENCLRDSSTFHKWHFVRSIPLFASGKFERLVNKYKVLSKIDQRRLVFRLYETAYDCLNNALKSQKRKLMITSNILKFEALDRILSLVYVLNNEPSPSTKWKLFLIKNLKWKPEDLTEERLNEISIRTLLGILMDLKKMIIQKRILSSDDLSIIS